MANYGPFQCKNFQYLSVLSDKTEGVDVVLFHGFGADMSDLFPLTNYLHSSKTKNFYFPNGVIKAPGMPMGRAWFPIDVEALEKAMMTGSHRNFDRPIPQEIHGLCSKIEESLINELNLDPSKTIIGGFSQGAMISMNLILNSPYKFKALIQMSGTFLERNYWLKKMQQKEKMNIFLSHGFQDALLNPKDAEDLAASLTENGHNVYSKFFQGGHEIPLDVLKELKSFIEKQ
ncbi:MAG: hypothetical protein VX642_11590 [Bdellovibrionota bacterium]|nr:hypothetical protein [Bdellovibrionota bacterium]